MLATLVMSCDRVEEFPVDRGTAFFPLKVGAWAIYNVDSTRIIQNVSNGFHYQLKLTVADSFPGNGGLYTYIIQREKRTNESALWKPAGTWSAWADDRQAVMSEGNLRFVKLQFPLEPGLKWNGNELNTQGGDEQCDGKQCDRYEITSTTETFTNEFITAGAAVIVTQQEDNDVLVRQDIRSEVYVRDIGLVRRDVIVLDYCTEHDCYGKQFVNSGLIYKMEITEYGHNAG